MTFTISFGWWLIPAAVTLVAFVTAWWNGRSLFDGNPSRSDWVGPLILLGYYMMAAIVSLIAWLIWAVLT